MLRRLRLRTRIVLTVFTTAAIAIAGGAYLIIRFFEATLFEAALKSTEGDIEELRAVLNEDMLASHKASLNALVSQIARGPGVAWVGVVDERATVRISSDQGPSSAQFSEGSPEREHLARWQASLQPQSRAYISDGCGVLRVMAPIENTQKCWACHDKRRAITGMLVIDRSLQPLKETVRVATTRIALGGIAALVLILGCLGFVFEHAVLLRLDRIRRTAQRLGGGDLAARARDGGSDELSDVAREFDGMASRLEAAMTNLASQRRRLDEIVNGIADGILLLDLRGRVVTMNRALMARVAGEPPLPGVPYRQLVRAAGIDLEAGELPAERALVSGQLEKAVVAVGAHRCEELYAQPLLGPEGHPTAVIEVWRDITDRKVLEASVEQSERLASMGVLASSVAHEVGNPLASIMTAVDGLLTRLPERRGDAQDEIREYLEIVRKQVFRCRGATERLLGFARVPSAGRDAVVDVARAVREVAKLVEAQATAQGVALDVRAPASALALAADMAVEQVLLNLLLNALKAMPSGGRLRLEVEATELAVTVVVGDTGHGISADVAKHLFQPFRTSTHRRGTGLGLFISHALVQRSGGKIEVESTPGRGAIFTVRLRPASLEAHAVPEERMEALS